MGAAQDDERERAVLQGGLHLRFRPRRHAAGVRLHPAVRRQRLRPLQQIGILQRQHLVDVACEEQPPRGAQLQ